MGLILDTCVLIRAEKQSHAIDFAQWQAYGETFLSVVTVSELLVGVHHADSEARRLKRSAFVEMVIQAIPVIDFTRDVARIHAEIYSYLAKKGRLIGAHDLIIAATALTHGYALLTANQKEFSRVPGLKVISL